MRKLKDYTKEFIGDESGMEILQSAGIIVISVLLLAVLFVLGNTIYDYISEATDVATDTFGDTLDSARSASAEASSSR